MIPGRARLSISHRVNPFHCRKFPVTDQQLRIQSSRIILPSPIVHTTVGYLIYRSLRNQIPYPVREKFTILPPLLIAAVGFSQLPDIDSIAGIIFGDFGRFHNNLSHSFLVGFVVSTLFAFVIWLIKRKEFWKWFTVSILGYSLHILMDYFTFGGRGIMLFWPLSQERFEAPLKLFFGVRWSESIYNPIHFITIFSELVSLILVMILWQIINRSKTLLSGKLFDSSK